MSKTLVIVESPTKAKTISKFLGKDYQIESSFGHVRDLPKSKMGIDIEGGTFEPQYELTKAKANNIKKLKDAAKKCSEIIFATDEDREGEAISWHLAYILKIDPAKAKRIAFHEITKHAIEEALSKPRHIDQNLVDAQQARRVLDRLVGYELSPLLWKKVARGLSAGRVQSVAVRLVVEREREIKAFISEEYWSIAGQFEKEHKFLANLHSINNKNLKKLEIKNETRVKEILSDLKNAKYTISNIEKKETKKTPPPPFTTSSLQQTAHNACGYSAKQIMRLAQQLYEGIDLGSEGHVGLITYMRTDSLFLSEKFLGETNDYVKKQYGDKYALDKPRFYKNKSKGAQEAHEAIRPTDPTRNPESIEKYLDPQQYKMYSLIWKRALATQMSEARLNKTNIDINNKQKPEEKNKQSNYMFRANGQTMIFDGWLKLYPDLVKEEMLPELKKDEDIECKELKSEQHFTKPPARYSDATLVKALEEYGIGRPSTYAPTIATIEAREYVFRNDDKRLEPNDIAMVVNDLLVEHFPKIVDYEFTAKMEQKFDDIEEGKEEWKPIIKEFYDPFHKNIETKTEELDKQDVVHAHEVGIDPKSGKPISARIGRFGPFVQLGTKDDEEKPTFASLEKGMSVETVTLEQALKLLSLPRTLGTDADGNEVFADKGRYGPYVKTNGIFYSTKDKDPYNIELKEALEVIKEGKEKEAKKTIKEFDGSEIKILNGRYGPYITDGEKNGKMPKEIEDPATLTLEQCEEIMKDAKPARRGKKTTKNK
ncbi:type I DNA topoisomerase [Patescibacteria group bacterium]|nr:type I DNA topoisomerase [Patescibacteria group bacterium]MBU1895496.1 type I DNA topoisomerase [Patescibacteria group bacterium]